MQIAVRFSSCPCFSGYTFRDDMVSEAVARCIQVALPKLDPEKEIFSYLTQTIRNVFLSKIYKERKFLKLKLRMQAEIEGKEFHDTYEENKEDTDEDFCSPSSREHSLEAEGDFDFSGSGETEEDDSYFD